MTAPRLSSATLLHLGGAEAPTVRALWHDAGQLGVTFRGDDASTYLGLVGTPQEVRLALAKGLAAIDRAVAERAAQPEEATVP
jgi:hypothetical protein